MRAVVQRVKEASVEVDEKITGSIDKGLLVFLGVGSEDSSEDVDYLVNKIKGLRIFEDKDDKMNLSVEDIEGQILVISQFTIYGDVRKGRRPNFMNSANPDLALELYEEFIARLKKDSGLKIEKGVFAADMDVELINDGPVTILLDSKKIF